MESFSQDQISRGVTKLQSRSDACKDARDGEMNDEKSEPDYLKQGLYDERNRVPDELERHGKAPVRLESFRKKLPAHEKRDQLIGKFS